MAVAPAAQHRFAQVRRPGAWGAALLILGLSWGVVGRWTPWHSHFSLLMASYGIACGLMWMALAGTRARSPALMYALGAGCSGVAGLLAAAMVRAAEDSLRYGLGAWVVEAGMGASFAAVVVGTVLFRQHAEDRRARIDADRSARQLQQQSHLKQLAEMKLKALQAQIEPHFLYNTLASIQHLVRTDPGEADRLMEHLIAYLKSTVPHISARATVGEEVSRVAAYLAIMRMRMPDRLDYTIDIAPEAGELPLPPLSLITLVENSVKHGIEPRPRGGRIRLSGSVRDDRVELIVADDGVGFAEETGGGVGLTNLRERLHALHGDGAALELAGVPGGGVEAILSLPAGQRANHAG